MRTNYLLSLLAMWAFAGATPAQAEDPFRDMDHGHWAYKAVQEMWQRGFLVGYPDDYLRGKRAMTRYELSVAFRRKIDNGTYGATSGMVMAERKTDGNTAAFAKELPYRRQKAR